MREDYDKGESNHLSEYIDNLVINFEGALESHPALLAYKEIIDVRNNIAFLKLHMDIDFKIWRATILRSTRLLHAVLARLEKGE
jgi:uncharacterized protein YehS (DUF1456 family)